MATGRTPNFNLSTLGPGDKLSDDGYKYPKADRELIDRLLKLGTTAHRHNGSSGAGTDSPTDPLDLTQSDAGGSIPAGTRVYYKYSWVDVNGFETMPSIEAFIDTPAPIASPASAAAVFDNVGGTLVPGQYWYVITAYVAAITQETLGATPVAVNVPVGTSTNRITLTLPSLPVGASGFNIYRRKPGGNQYFYVGSVAGGGGTDWVDNGIADDCNRTTPVSNTTNATNTITATLPDDVPVGLTWRLYRTYVNGQYERSLLHWVVEETAEGSGIVTTEYVDIGEGTSEGRPAETNQGQNVASPEKIDLDDAAEVQGRLPIGHVQAFPIVVTLEVPGAQTVGTSKRIWVCEFPTAKIIGVRLALCDVPAVTDIIVDINKGSGATPIFDTIFTTQDNRPYVMASLLIGPRTVPDVVDLIAGDALTVDVDQAGGGATPTDRDMVVQILMLAQFENEDSNMEWS